MRPGATWRLLRSIYLSIRCYQRRLSAAGDDNTSGPAPVEAGRTIVPGTGSAFLDAGGRKGWRDDRVPTQNGRGVGSELLCDAGARGTAACCAAGVFVCKQETRQGRGGISRQGRSRRRGV